ncbi:WD40 repeat domain-containing protein [Aquisphaera insulae]|uniref:WD40 repeat domain-containing protein n=1 Tax=Aquisphaera insulae TaxID=2712864 RepID=UPI0013EC1FB1|nr:WD40 repeat domain-containing protein [Aquisphaera insulae]
MDHRSTRPSRREFPAASPSRWDERVSGGRAPSVPAGSSVRCVLAIAGAIGLASLVGPREESATTSDITGEHSGLILAMAISPDGRWLASSGFEGSIRIWDLAERRIVTNLEPEDGPAYGLAWSPDGSALAATGVRRGITLWDARTWDRIAELRDHAGPARSLAWSPDGSTLAAGCLDSTVALWDTSRWRPRALLRGHSGGINAVAFSGDSRALVSAGSDGLIGIWDAASGRPIGLRPAGVLALSGLACTPAGEVFATCNTGPGAFRCRWAGASAGSSVLNGGGPYVALAASPDGRLLAATTPLGLIDLWQLSPERRIATLEGHSGPIQALAFTPDGQSLLSGGTDGTIRRWQGRNDDNGSTRWRPDDTQGAIAAASSPKS